MLQLHLTWQHRSCLRAARIKKCVKLTALGLQKQLPEAKDTNFVSLFLMQNPLRNRISHLNNGLSSECLFLFVLGKDYYLSPFLCLQKIRCFALEVLTFTLHSELYF